MRRGLAIALLLAAAAVTGCNDAGRARPNVVLIVLDTQRMDRVGAYGAPRPTPFLDKLAAESLVYQRAYAPSSWTVPSIASLFLAQYPSEHRIAVVMAVLPDSVVTLAERLHEGGYRTGGFSANIEVTAEAGFGQGFDAFRTVFKAPKEDASKLNEAAIQWLDEIGDRKEPLFLYLQYMEPHSPYRDHPGITATDPPPLPGEWADYKLAERVNEGAFLLATGQPLPDTWKMTPAELGRLKALYDGETTYLDRHVAAMFAELDRRGLLENALVVVTADHGEHLGEHGMLSHGNTLYEEVIRVPLLVRLPERTGRRIDEPVTIAGLAPAILRRVGLPIPQEFVVPPLPLDGSPGPGYALAEVLRVNPTYLRYHRRALVGRSGKLLVQEDGGEVFIDLATDPGEEHPLPDAPFAPELRKALADAAQGHPMAAPRPGASVDDATRERLRALGYAD
jgi:arylsulfatase A-like enzyme